MTQSVDYRVLLALYGLSLPLCLWFGVIGRRRWRESVPRAIFWWAGSGMGAAFLALSTVSMFMVEPAFGRFDVGQQLVRVFSLVSGVLFVFYALVALEPLVLDALERHSFVTFVSARMMRASKSGFLTVISVLSIAGVGVSSCALCCVTSIMGGFGHDLKRKILGNTAHIVVDVPGSAGFEGWKPVLSAVRAAVEPQGGAATPVVGGDAMASSATNTAGTLVRGIDPETISTVIKLTDNIELGKFDYLVHPDKLLTLPPDEVIGRGPTGEPYAKGPSFRIPSELDPEVRELLPDREVLPGIILGRELAKSLHVMVGDDLTMLSPMGELGPTGIMPRARKFRVAAIFYSGMYEYDASHAYVLIDVAQRFFDFQTRISRIDIRVPIPEEVMKLRPAVDRVVADVNAERGAKLDDYDPLRVLDWKELNKNLFSALALEKVATFIILSIAIAVASFCIICTLLLMVTEKIKEIAVLKSLGTSDLGVMKVFMLEGILIGAFGTILGVVMALAFCLGLSWTGFRLDPDVYYIDRLPVNVDLGDYGLVALAALVICTIATVYPAFTASRIKPVEGLRYE